MKNDKTITLAFNSKLNEDTVNDMNVFVSDSNNNDIWIDLSLSNTEELIYLVPKNRLYNNDFYTLNISTDLKSKGGNHLSMAKNFPFYVPFH